MGQLAPLPEHLCPAALQVMKRGTKGTVLFVPLFFKRTFGVLSEGAQKEKILPKEARTTRSGTMNW